ncbi:MAG: glutaredoxin domain-containing protein [Patescibacteria group bacterium]
MKNVTIYTTQTCTYCKMAKEFFKEKGVNYSEVDLGVDAVKREEMRAKMESMGQGLAVPIIDVGGKTILGFDRNSLAGELGIAA